MTDPIMKKFMIEVKYYPDTESIFLKTYPIGGSKRIARMKKKSVKQIVSSDNGEILL